MDFKQIPQIICIYILTNLINGKVYVGKTKHLRKRIREHTYESADQVIDRAIKKYGIENFKIEVLYKYDILPDNKYEMLAMETAFIEFYESTNSEIGYNICIIGSNPINTIPSKEHRRKLSISKTGNLNPMFGKKGKDNPSYGIKRTDKQKEQNRIARLGKKHSEESKIKNSISQLKRLDWKKPVKQINKITNEIIKIWTSATDAEKELGINNKDISSVCTKRIDKNGYGRAAAGGFKWEYAN